MLKERTLNIKLFPTLPMELFAMLSFSGNGLVTCVLKFFFFLFGSQNRDFIFHGCLSYMCIFVVVLDSWSDNPIQAIFLAEFSLYESNVPYVLTFLFLLICRNTGNLLGETFSSFLARLLNIFLESSYRWQERMFNIVNGNMRQQQARYLPGNAGVLHLLFIPGTWQTNRPEVLGIYPVLILLFGMFPTSP